MEKQNRNSREMVWSFVATRKTTMAVIAVSVWMIAMRCFVKDVLAQEIRVGLVTMDRFQQESHGHQAKIKDVSFGQRHSGDKYD